MSLERRLDRWRAAGLIDDEAVGRIARWERENRRPAVVPVLATIGAGTLALGIIALVAANWDAISGRWKVACDLALGTALAAAAFVAARRGERVATDVLVVVLWGFTLASLALVGQVYQLDAPAWRPLLAWSAATAPLVLLARGDAAAALAALGLLATEAVGIGALVDWLGGHPGVSPADAANATAVLVAAAPLPWIALGRMPGFAARYPAHASVAEATGWIGWALLALLAGFAWTSRGGAFELGWGLAAIAAIEGALVAALPALHPAVPPQARLGLAVAAALAWGSLAGLRLPREAWPSAAAVAQIGVLAAIAWACAASRRTGLFRLLAALVGVRIFAVYLEVFGSLLQTGLGLVLAGLLLLALTVLGRRRSSRVAAPDARRGGGEGHG